jgi:hypothetical protein
MNRNWLYLIAVMTLPMLRVLINDVHIDDWLHAKHHDVIANFVTALRDNDKFQEFIGGWVFPAFLSLFFMYWIIQEDKSRIPMQFMLMPLAYIPFSIVGFTLVHAEFQVSYLYANPLIILTFGYAYVLFWAGAIKLFEKLKLVE